MATKRKTAPKKQDQNFDILLMENNLILKMDAWKRDKKPTTWDYTLNDMVFSYCRFESKDDAYKHAYSLCLKILNEKITLPIRAHYVMKDFEMKRMVEVISKM